MPDPNRFKNISKILSAVSRSSSFFATAHFTAAPSRLLSIAVQTCLSSFKLSCSRCSLMTSTHVSMHPSETSLNSFGFLKVFLDLPPHLSLESVFLVANASNILFIISQVLAHVMASGPTFLFVVDSPWTTRRICCSTLHNCLAPSPPPGAVLAASRVNGNGVDSRLFRCGSTKSTLLPCVGFVTRLSCVRKFFKMTSSLDCMAHELSAWSLLIVSILVSRLSSLLFTVSYRCFISYMSFTMFF